MLQLFCFVWALIKFNLDLHRSWLFFIFENAFLLFIYRSISYMYPPKSPKFLFFIFLFSFAPFPILFLIKFSISNQRWRAWKTWYIRTTCIISTYKISRHNFFAFWFILILMVINGYFMQSLNLCLKFIWWLHRRVPIGCSFVMLIKVCGRCRYGRLRDAQKENPTFCSLFFELRAWESQQRISSFLALYLTGTHQIRAIIFNMNGGWIIIFVWFISKEWFFWLVVVANFERWNLSNSHFCECKELHYSAL